MKKIVFSTFIICMLLISCKTGKKALERGDYYNATLQAVNRLRSNPDSEKALKAVKDSYPMSLDYFQGKIDYALSANSPFKYTEIVDYYEKMNRLSDEVSRCPAALKIFPHVNYYTSELVEARKSAAEEQYIAGLSNEKINTRLSWKDAYYNYQQAEHFLPGYKDARDRQDQAKYNATLKVIVEQISVTRKYQLSSDFFLNQIIESLRTNRPNEFVEYYSPEVAENAGIKYPDQVLRMNFDEFIIGQVYDKETVRDLSRDSVEVGSVVMPDGSKKIVYNTVKAKMTTYHRELISNGTLDVSIIDFPSNTVVSQRKFSGQYVWFTEWGSFNGDDRALNKDQIAMCNRKPILPPAHQDLFVEFTKPIYNQVTPFLKTFYKKY
jgi:hypothetical protein